LFVLAPRPPRFPPVTAGPPCPAARIARTSTQTAVRRKMSVLRWENPEVRIRFAEAVWLHDADRKLPTPALFVEGDVVARGDQTGVE